MFINKETNRLSAELDQILKQNDDCCNFEDWARKEIKYHKYYRLLRYNWLKPLLNKEDPFTSKPASFNMDFLQNATLNNPEALDAQYYNKFLHEYLHSFYLQMKRQADSVNHKFTYRQRIKNTIKNEKDGFVRYYLLTDLYGEILEFAPLDTLESVTSFVLNNLHYGPMREYVQDQYWKAKYYDEVNSALLNRSPNSSVWRILDNMIYKHQNDLIYIDIWADWCGACIKKLPQLKKMQKKFEYKPVTFVTMAIESNRLKIKEILLKEELKTENYLLNENQTQQLKDSLKFSSIPRYILIDKTGKIINDNAPPPGNETHKLLEKYLK